MPVCCIRVCKLRFLIGFCCLLILQASCTQQNGTTKNGGPVSRAQNDSQEATAKDKAKQRLLEQLRKSGVKQNGNQIQPRFQDCAEQLGLKHEPFRDAKPGRFFFPEIMGSGIGWIDFDLDGYWDLYLGTGDLLVGTAKHPNQIHRNLSGELFTDVTNMACPDGFGYAQGVAVGDCNLDGFDDVFVANYGNNALYINQGDGSFLQQRFDYRPGQPNWGTSCIQVDLDRDGDLDVFVTRYVHWTPELDHSCDYSGVRGYCGPGTYQGTQDLVLENLGDGTYRELDGANLLKSKGLVVSAADLDGDRIPEIYVGSDLTGNLLYKSKNILGKIEFENVAADAGVANSKNGIAQATMGLAIKDFDDNGYPDLFLTHYYQDQNTIYLNQGDSFFKDASYETRLRALSLDTISFGTVALDYDLDSDFDLFVANGHVLGEHIPPFRFQPQLLANDRGKFFAAGKNAGDYFQQKHAGRSVAHCDIDNDGDYDIAVGHIDQPMAMLVNETKNSHHYLQLQLVDLERKDIVGSRVEVSFDGRTIVIPIVCGESYLAAVDRRLIVGVGSAEHVDVTVKWPSGQDTRYRQLASNKSWVLNSNNESHLVGKQP